MSQDIHERAKQLITGSRYNGVAGSDRAWLELHLAECPECARYSAQIEGVIGALRTVSVMPSPGLVSVTQLRVRERAHELRARQAAMRPLWIACTVAVLSSIVTTGYLWVGFAWLGRNLRLPDPAWQLIFVLSWMVPGVIGAALLVARRTHVAQHEETEFHIRG